MKTDPSPDAVGDPPRRARKPAEQRRAEILAAAGPIFAEHGYRATDVQLIADRAGVGKGTVYRFFPTKEALFLATMADLVERLSNEVEARTTGMEDPWEVACLSIRSYFAFFERHPEAVELFVHERAEFRDRCTPVYFAHSESRRQRWVDLHRQLGLTDDTWPTPEQAVDMFGDMMFGTIFVNALAPRRPPLTERAEEMIRLLARMLRRDDAPPA
ncbi:TetR/AcrR family transcriptional regulator [Isoalcanivorax indicus]|uniref:TetR/AcrR family transcriptional regulator n=1 Tax=Isoalcanivorax indicus TaxID=2202653 RepID=UPI000DB9E807|nr:TetR/AcrR family transcriptional regulator [Isoalcanivorax indicus]